VRTHPADGEGEGKAFTDLGQGFGVLAVGNEPHVGADVQVGRAGGLADGMSSLKMLYSPVLGLK